MRFLLFLTSCDNFYKIEMSSKLINFTYKNNILLNRIRFSQHHLSKTFYEQIRDKYNYTITQ